ncbi:MAG TPA: TonB-dependent receptor, partial [Candidatus Limnocylindrales bacterium]|nr:TonB-dependent receptor [Candidatus Limnocylindrales bacterium]
MASKPRFLPVVSALVLSILFAAIAAGQVLKGSISGTAVDPQGAVLAGAQVTATNMATGTVLKTTTDNSGLFRFNLIPAGDYKVQVSAQGFNSAVQTDVPVTAGRDTGLGSIKLAVGQTSTTVEVTAQAPLIESTQAQVTNTFAGTQLATFAGVQENQGLDNLALFVPGVSSSRDNNFSNFNGGQGFSSNGLRGRNNDQQIDGQNNNDNSVAGPALFVTNPEFVNQYVLITNQFGPEYGRNSGSVVNVITKSGGNEWHGSIFGSENNSVLNAMSNFQKRFDTDINGNPLTKPPRLNDEFAGFTIGGPFVKNRMFFFGGFDQEIISQNSIFSSGNNLTPTPAGLATLAACFPSGPSSAAVQALSKFGPFGISAGNPVATSPFIPGPGDPAAVAGCPGVEFSGVSRTLKAPSHIFDWIVRTDIQFGSDTLTGRYMFNRNNTFNSEDNGAAGYVLNVPALGQAVLLSWTHNLSSKMVNEARVSFGRTNVEFGGNTIGNTEPTANNLDQAVTNVLFRFPGNLGFGPATNLPQQRIVNTWQGQDNWNYVLGKHQLKAGVNYTYQRTPNIFLPNINGQFRFNDWSSYFANTPNRIRIAQGPTGLDFREHDTFLYFGDDWKMSQGLTINLGLTWSYYGQPANLFNDITTARESNPATAFWNPALPLSIRTFPRFDAPKTSFGPSAGFAWSPQGGGILTGNGKTVIRGGYRLLYDPPFYNIYLNMATSAPQVFLQTFTGAAAAGLPMPAVPTGPNVRALLAPFITPGVIDPRTQAETSIASNFGPDKVHTWSFGLERELSRNAALEVRYVGNRAANLFQTINGNPFISDLQASFPTLVPSGLTPCPATQQIGPGAGTDIGRVNCGQGVLRTRTNTGYSHYHALQTEFRANNLFKQLTVRTSYTFSKTLDNVSEIFGTFGAGNSIAFSQNPLDFKGGEYSFSGLDFPHQWSILFTEQLPFLKDQHGFFGHLLGGWAISANYLVASGQR